MNMEVVSEEELVNLITQSNEQALEELYDRFAPTVMGVAYRIVRSRGVAEEIVQETFCRVWDKSDTFDASKGNAKAWLFRIARNLALDNVRRQKIRPQAAASENAELMMAQEPDEDANVAESAWASMRREQLQDALGQLPNEQQQVLELAYFEGYTRKEISSATGLALGTVHTRARLGLQKMRDLLKVDDFNV